MYRARLLVLTLLCGGVCVRPALPQGMQTAALGGTVTTTDGATVPDTTVRLASPALQGVRTTHSNAHGDYVVRGLLPGTYTVTFEHAGLDWEKHVRLDERYVRPTETTALIGDPTKARERLGWQARVHTEELVRIMVDASDALKPGLRIEAVLVRQEP